MSDVGGQGRLSPAVLGRAFGFGDSKRDTDFTDVHRSFLIPLICVRLFSLCAWPSDGMTTERAFGRRFVPPLQGWLIYGVESRGVTSGYIISPFQGDQGRGQLVCVWEALIPRQIVWAVCEEALLPVHLPKGVTPR